MKITDERLEEISERSGIDKEVLREKIENGEDLMSLFGGLKNGNRTRSGSGKILIGTGKTFSGDKMGTGAFLETKEANEIKN